MKAVMPGAFHCGNDAVDDENPAIFFNANVLQLLGSVPYCFLSRTMFEPN
jgi:hypothetical protein